MADTPVNTNEQMTKMKKEEMEKWQRGNMPQRRNVMENDDTMAGKMADMKGKHRRAGTASLHNIHTNECNHAKDSTWKYKQWKWD